MGETSDAHEASGAKRLLIVDDEESLRSAVNMMLKDSGYRVLEARDGVEAVVLFERERPDLVVLDIMIPRIDGFEVCSIIRKMSPRTPLLLLSAKREVTDRVAGLRLGADDYLTKPFNQEELLLRIEALLRRSMPSSAPDVESVTVGSLCIDFRQREVRLDGKVVGLTPKEFAILSLLGGNVGRTYTKDEIISKVWGTEYSSTAVSVPTHIRHIREKIEQNPAMPTYLQTVGRLGYRLREREGHPGPVMTNPHVIERNLEVT